MGKNISDQKSTLAQNTKIYGIVGCPLAQSLSPLLHNAAFAALNMPAIYQRWEVLPHELTSFVQKVRKRPIQGCSVTIPHKVDILKLLDAVSPAVMRVGAANTLYWKGELLCGENTDVAGFMAPLARAELAAKLAHSDVLLLGAGGAARAVAAGLSSLPEGKGPGRIFVATPSDRSHLPLVSDFGLLALRWSERHNVPASLIINATPLGMRGDLQRQKAYSFEAGKVQQATIAYDLVYNPLETAFLHEARAAGLICISGLEMFYEQANAQFRLWTGQPLPAEARKALETALGASALRSQTET
jgi:shikimate dehydrogenase